MKTIRLPDPLYCNDIVCSEKYSLIRIDCKPVFFREWLAKGILTVKSLIKDETCFLSYTEFLNKYQCKRFPLAFSGIIALNVDSEDEIQEKYTVWRLLRLNLSLKLSKKRRNTAIYRIEISLQKRVKNPELPKQNGTEIATSMRKK